MQPTTPLCDYCHQKPNFPGHKFCSKSCASQAATLCNNCQKKPKFQNYDFCSKKCGSLANAKTRNGAAPTSMTMTMTTPTPTVQSNQAKTTNTAAPQQKAANPTFDPVQMAKLIVQQIPQLQASVTPQNNANNTSATNPQSNNPPNVTSKTPPTNPYLSVSAMATAQSASPASNVNVADSTDPSQQPAECLIPGCGQPVHVSSDSKQSEYCSTRHREEAVASGLASPCIMCLTLPQSETDYFCSRECRQEALHKQVIGAA